MRRPDKRGQTVLLLAALNGHEDVVRMLIKAKAKLDAKDKVGTRPRRGGWAGGWGGGQGRRHRRSRFTNRDLRRHRAVPHSLPPPSTLVQEDRTVLMNGAISGSPSVCSLLLDAGAALDLVDKVCEAAKPLHAHHAVRVTLCRTEGGFQLTP